MADNTTMKIRALLIAEAANPQWVSVPLEGWAHSQAIARRTEAHLVTQIRNREAILSTGLVEGRDFTAIDSEAIAAPMYRLAKKLRGGTGAGWTIETASAALRYPYFERLVWERFGPRIRAGEFDIVHRLTPLSPTTASALAGRCREAGVPFVLGPLNGGVPWPKGFDSARRREKEWLSYVRDAYRLMPGYHATRQNSRALIIGSRDTWAQMPRSYRRKCVYIPENAIDPGRFTRQRQRQAVRPIKAVFVGRLVPYKGADMLLKAAGPLIKAGALQVQIIGDGPQMPLLRELVEREGIASGVNLAGWVKHDQLQDHLCQADVFAFPSIREFGGAVVLEAMAVGLIPIVIDYGGPGELVTPQTGFTIPIGPREQIITQLRARLAELAERPEQIDQRSAACIERVRRHFTWDAKAAQVLEVYQWVLGRRDKPDFGMPLP